MTAIPGLVWSLVPCRLFGLLDSFIVVLDSSSSTALTCLFAQVQPASAPRHVAPHPFGPVSPRTNPRHRDYQSRLFSALFLLPVF